MNKVSGLILLGLGGGLIGYAFLRKENKVTMSDIDSYIEHLEKSGTNEKVNCILLLDEHKKSIAELNSITKSNSPKTQDVLSKKSLLETRVKKLGALITKNNCSDLYTDRELSECIIIDDNIKYYTDTKNSVGAAEAEFKFVKLKCRDKIEYNRQKTSATQFSKEAESAESSVLGKSSSEQYVYIGVGSLVLLAGLIIIIKK
jgi:hypothetical protein